MSYSKEIQKMCTHFIHDFPARVTLECLGMEPYVRQCGMGVHCSFCLPGGPSLSQSVQCMSCWPCECHELWSRVLTDCPGCCSIGDVTHCECEGDASPNSVVIVVWAS